MNIHRLKNLASVANDPTLERGHNTVMLQRDIVEVISSLIQVKENIVRGEERGRWRNKEDREVFSASLLNTILLTRYHLSHQRDW